MKEPTPDAKRVHRAVMEALMIAYDEDKKAYAQGYTDQRIADETSAAIEYVRKTREDYFGPLAAPSEFTALNRELDEITGRLNKSRDDMATVVQNLADSIDALHKRFHSVAVRNGWA